MATIPFYTRQTGAAVQSQPRGSMQAAAAPWQALGDAARAVQGLGEMGMKYAQARKDYANKQAEITRKSEVAKATSDWSIKKKSANLTLQELGSPEEIASAYKKINDEDLGPWWQSQPEHVKEQLGEWMDTEKMGFELSVFGAAGIHTKKTNDRNESRFREQEQIAIDSGNEDMHAAAIQGLLESDVINESQAGQRLREFEQKRKTSYGLKLLSSDFVQFDAWYTENREKLLPDDQAMFDLRHTEAQRRIEADTLTAQTGAFTSAMTSIQKGEARTEDIERLKEPVHVGYGVYVPQANDSQIELLKATLTSSVQAEKNTNEYRKTEEKIAGLKGTADLAQWKIVEKWLVNDKGGSRFSAEGMSTLLQMVSDNLSDGKINPEGVNYPFGWGNSFTPNENYKTSIVELNGLYDKAQDLGLEKDESFMFWKNASTALRELTQEHGKSLEYSSKLQEWREQYIKPLEIQVFQEETKRKYSPLADKTEVKWSDL